MSFVLEAAERVRVGRDVDETRQLYQRNPSNAHNCEVYVDPGVGRAIGLWSVTANMHAIYCRTEANHRIPISRSEISGLAFCVLYFVVDPFEVPLQSEA